MCARKKFDSNHDLLSRLLLERRATPSVPANLSDQIDGLDAQGRELLTPDQKDVQDLISLVSRAGNVRFSLTLGSRNAGWVVDNVFHLSCPSNTEDFDTN